MLPDVLGAPAAVKTASLFQCARDRGAVAEVLRAAGVLEDRVVEVEPVERAAPATAAATTAAAAGEERSRQHGRTEREPTHVEPSCGPEPAAHPRKGQS
jgi:hypothetical protein